MKNLTIEEMAKNERKLNAKQKRKQKVDVIVESIMQPINTICDDYKKSKHGN